MEANKHLAQKSLAAKSIEEKLKNNRTLRDVRREMGKFCLDCTKITLSIRRGTLTIFGKFAPLSGNESIFSDELKALTRALQGMAEVDKVIFQ
ncbi:hypothetical protein [Armatimonas rosea]|uniref:Uncharacterized protein n=1 Tax=Armatimonas rosea TaxID=685828 RepID=A0A7W9SNS2_ARMRO|nr:hypothetical protein [Armatimonas rosea]MBB6049388.1 hypothetical protein [Armatimonas rosea]